MTSARIFPFAIALFAVNTIIFYILLGNLLRRLKTHHTTEWQRLGKPGILRNNSVSNGLRTAAFALRGEHHRLADPELNTIIRAYRGSFVVEIVGLIVIAGLILYGVT